MSPTNDDEIDLFELLQTLWDGKWLISAFVAVAVLLGGGFLLFREAVYESKLIYSVGTIPPFYEEDRILVDFQNRFHSASVFEKWKQNSSNSSLTFDDISETEVVDGFVMSKREDARLATLKSGKTDGSFVLIKSNQFPVIDGFFKYTTHINEALTKEYVQRAKKELSIIETRFENFSRANDNIIAEILSIDRYIVSAEKGSSVLAIQRPTMPRKVSPKSTLILVMCLVLGGMVGVSFILMRNAITKRKEQLAEA